MRDEEDGGAGFAADLRDALDEQRLVLGQDCEGFVEQEQSGMTQERLGEGDALFSPPERTE